MKVGVFQAVSAFCNAGFSLTPDSLSSLTHSPLPLMVYGMLIVLGSMGFVVLSELGARFISRAPTISAQTKIVVLMTIILIAGGGLLFSILEWDGALANLTNRDKIVNSLFYSVSLRTAGFHTISPELFSYASLVVMLFLMFVGGAPSGTAGGVKVTTIATLIATLPSLIRNDNRVVLFRRKFSMKTVAKSSALIVLSIASIGVLWFFLLLTQDLSPIALLFEVFSATGTVGLSLGSTDKLTMTGHIIIALGMFIGRIGPLTLALALAKDDLSRIEYPSADIMIG